MAQARRAGRPTRQEGEALARALLDTARELFCEKGFAETSIDEIAQRLRASKHTIYRQYPNKLELLGAVVERDIEHFRAALVTSKSIHTDPWSALRAVARTYFGFAISRDHSALYAAITLEALRSERMRTELARWTEAALVPLHDALAGAEAGHDPAEACEVLIDLLDGAANRMKWQQVEYQEATLERTFDARWDIFLAVMKTLNDRAH